jgi:hypothetical protein
MKIFEITKVNEVELSQLSQRIQGLVSNISSKIQGIATNQPGSTNAEPGAGDTGPSTRGGERGAGNDARGMLRDAVAKVRSGEAKLSKDADAELGKRGADPQDIHIAIVSKQQEAARDVAEQVNQAAGRTGRSATATYRRADLMIKMALFGYINKKYLGGDDQNFRGNTMDIVTRALQSQAPVGGQQPAGRQSSARPQGQQGTVGSGQGTNALDAMAADAARNADW